ncbi:MAG: hypothetical protein RXP91_06030 [Nitrososphaeria archaeon]
MSPTTSLYSSRVAPPLEMRSISLSSPSAIIMAALETWPMMGTPALP